MVNLRDTDRDDKIDNIPRFMKHIHAEQVSLPLENKECSNI